MTNPSGCSLNILRFSVTALILVLPLWGKAHAGTVIWFEAEHAAWSNLDDVYLAAGLSGGQALHFSTDSDSLPGRYRARYPVDIPDSGEYALWGRRHLYYYDEGNIPLLTRLKRYVEISWRIDGGPWRSGSSTTAPEGVEGPYPTSVGHLGYTRTGDGEMAGKTIGWYRDGTVALPEGRHDIEIEFSLVQDTISPLWGPRLDRVYGLLDAFVLADTTYIPQHKSALLMRFPESLIPRHSLLRL